MQGLLILDTFLITILVWYCFKQMIEKSEQRMVIENLTLYNNTLTKMYDGIRSFKHDFVNFIQALEGYIKCNDMNGVKTMADSIYTECKSVCNMEMLNPQIINNPAVYNLLAHKFELANCQSITMSIEVNCDILTLSIDTYKLCRILGILIDNAIEAVKECTDKIIHVRFMKENDIKMIVVENSYLPKNIDLNRMFEKGYTTKTNNHGHGLGLWKVKDIVENTHNLEMNTIQGELFVQELKIKDIDKKLAFSFRTDKILLK